MIEHWRTIPNYPKYKISNFGNIKNIFGKQLKPFDRAKNSQNKLLKGYLSIHLCNGTKPRYKNFTIHYLVLLSFVGDRPDGYVINHKNGIKGDNRLDNLEYCTQSENRKQDFVHKRQSFLGSKNNLAKLMESDVLEIIKLRNTGHKYGFIMKRYKVSRSCVSSIMNGNRWNHLTNINI